MRSTNTVRVKPQPQPDPETARLYDEEAEQSVLGAVLLHTEALSEILQVLSSRTAEYFYFQHHAHIYNAMLALYENDRPIDVTTLSAHLKASGVIEKIGGISYLAELSSHVPTSANVQHYAEIVRECWRRRELKSISLALQLNDGRPVTEVISSVHTRLESIALVDDGPPLLAAVPAEWPAPLDPVAMRGLAGEWLDVVLPNSESDTAALLLTLLAAAGNAFGDASYYAVGDDQHTARLNVGIVGATAKGRKGASVSPVIRLLRDADPAWTLLNPRSGLVSGEGLINAVRDPNPDENDAGVIDKRTFVIEPELVRVIRASERSGCNLSALIRQAWDSGKLSSMSRHKPLTASDAHISLVCHITSEELRGALAQVELFNGFGNRILWCCSRRSKLVPMPQPSDPHAMLGLSGRLAEAIRRARQGGRVTFTDEAAEMWCACYARLSMERPGAIGAVLGRSEAYTQRLALTYALLDGAREITTDHLESAAAVWRYCEASAIYLFGGSTGDRLADKLYKAIHEKQDGLTRKQLMIDVCSGNAKADVLDAALKVLLDADLVVPEKLDTRGRPATKYKAKR